MTPLELLLTGTACFLLATTLAFAWLWWKEIDLRYQAERQRDDLRAVLKDAGSSNVVRFVDRDRERWYG
jgi:hypothetical protein